MKMISNMEEAQKQSLEESLKEWYRNRDPELTDQELEMLMKESMSKKKNK